MRTAALVVTLAFGLSLGCGSDPSPAPPPDSGGAGGGTGGGGGGTTPGGGGGGGTPGGGGGTTPGGGGGGGGTTGGGPGGGSAGPVTSADGSVSIERLDADPECDALVPARAADAVTVRVTNAGSCNGGTSDGSGHVAVATGLSAISGGLGLAVTWQVFSPAGAPEGTFDGRNLRLAPQPEGFQSVKAAGEGVRATQVDVLTLSGSGALRRTERATPPTSERSTLGWIHVEDPLGGSALVHWGLPQGGGACVGTVSRFDEAGAPSGTATYGKGDECRAAAAAVSGRGAALVVEVFRGAAWLWWIGADGRLARPAALAGDAATIFARSRGVALVPLLDGSIVAREGDTWTRHFPYLGDHAEDAPGWLSSRPGFTFRNTRGARGYALLPPPLVRSDDCAQQVELLAPSGRLCGRVTLKGDGASCSTSLVDQGWDGTVVQESARDHCAWRFWPRLLAGD